MKISFPGGCGGNWLSKLILNRSILTDSVNFHSHNRYLRRLTLTHEIDPNRFDYLYSGSSFFNFYINVLLKYFIHEKHIFDNTCYKESLLTCVNTAKFICTFDQIKQHIFLNFDDLVSNADVFLDKINHLQEKLQIKLTTADAFADYRKRFLQTCVNPNTIFENFDNMFWVCFVLGQLMNHNCVPVDFTIFEPSNQNKCKEFAQQNYHLCKLNKTHFFDTDIHFPVFAHQTN